MTLVPFATSADAPLAAGSDALIYVMRHGHTLSVPTALLYFAEKVAIVTIAARETDPAILASVNRAIDVIASSIRIRERLDRDAAVPAAAPAAAPDDRDGGHLSRLQPVQPRKPSPAAYADGLAF